MYAGVYRYKMGRNVRVGDVIMINDSESVPDAFYPKMTILVRKVVPLRVTSISRNAIDHLVFKDATSKRSTASHPDERVRILPDEDLKLVAI